MMLMGGEGPMKRSHCYGQIHTDSISHPSEFSYEHRLTVTVQILIV